MKKNERTAISNLRHIATFLGVEKGSSSRTYVRTVNSTYVPASRRSLL